MFFSNLEQHAKLVHIIIMSCMSPCGPQFSLLLTNLVSFNFTADASVLTEYHLRNNPSKCLLSSTKANPLVFCLQV